ncbi:MAG: hypothetical protein K0S47_4191 [Herbinix sp.]|jgi:hypothetical protein|nr:hypothetical protein [Herbinix sp.]
MITIFNRKKLMADISQIECNRVKQLLKEANIDYYQKAIKNAPSMSRYSDTIATSRVAMAYKDRTNFVYYIYVRKVDYTKARQIAYGKS